MKTSSLDLSSGLRTGVLRLARRLRAQPPEGLTVTEFATLRTVDALGPVSPLRIAEHEKVRPSSVTRVLASLQRQGLIERARHPHDGRRSLVALTPSGRMRLREDRTGEAWLTHQLSLLSSEERDVLRAAVHIINHLATD